MHSSVIRACRRAVRHGAVATFGALTFAVAAMPAWSPAQAGFEGGYAARQVEQISSGVAFSAGVAFTDGNHRQSVDVATVDLANPAVRIQPILSNDAVNGRERPSSMAERHSTPGSTAVVAINGDFWWPGYGSAPRGLHVQDGEVMAAGPIALPTLGIEGRASLRMETVRLQVAVGFPGGEFAVSQVNGGRRPGQVVLYTSRVGASTRTDSSGTEVLLRVSGRLEPRSSLTGTVVTVMKGHGNTPVSAGQMVLSGTDGGAGLLNRLAVGQSVTISSHMSNSAWDGIDNAIGGDQFLVHNGALSALTSRAHPRTAVGLTAKGDLLMVTVDGRQPGYSYGVTAPEMGTLMMQLGAVNAINFDGGGSTAMAVRAPGTGRLIVANSPSDGRQRAVTSSLVVFATATAGLARATASVDTTPPTSPKGLSVNTLPSRRAMLAWQDSRDDVTDVLHFAVYRDGRYIATTVRTAFVDRPRVAGVHTYKIIALDAAGNASVGTLPVTVRTAN